MLQAAFQPPTLWWISQLLVFPETLFPDNWLQACGWHILTKTDDPNLLEVAFGMRGDTEFSLRACDYFAVWVYRNGAQDKPLYR